MMKKTIIYQSLFLSCLVSACITPQFRRPENLGVPINTKFDESGPYLSADQKTLYFHSGRGSNSDDIWYATRNDATDAWNEPQLISDMVNDIFQSYGLSMSDDELTLYFASNSPDLGGEGNYDIWFSTRESRNSPWNFPQNIGRSINSPGVESDPRISRNGLELYFAELDMPPFRAGGAGGSDIWISRRQSQSDPWEQPENLTTVNSAFSDFTPSLAGNDLLLFFASNRKDGYGDFDIWVSRRESLTAPWGKPINVGPKINTAYRENRPYASSDGSTLYYGSAAAEGLGGMDIWKARINNIDRLGR